MLDKNTLRTLLDQNDPPGSVRRHMAIGHVAGTLLHFVAIGAGASAKDITSMLTPGERWEVYNAVKRVRERDIGHLEGKLFWGD